LLLLAGILLGAQPMRDPERDDALVLAADALAFKAVLLRVLVDGLPLYRQKEGDI
jgi:hypothetical protein